MKKRNNHTYSTSLREYRQKCFLHEQSATNASHRAARHERSRQPATAGFTRTHNVGRHLYIPHFGDFLARMHEHGNSWSICSLCIHTFIAGRGLMWPSRVLSLQERRKRWNVAKANETRKGRGYVYLCVNERYLDDAQRSRLRLISLLSWFLLQLDVLRAR